MTAYKIRFLNKSLGGLPSDFTLFSAVPVVKRSNDDVHVWSNSFLTRSVPEGGLWNVTINGASYAYCGTSSMQIPLADTTMDLTMIKQATLGSDHGAGSTFDVYSSDGLPAFQDGDLWKAPAGAYEINTGSDPLPNWRWIAGYGLSDDNGFTKPAATFAVDANSSYTISPPPAPKFHIGAFSSVSGSLIDPNTVPALATIDFAQHPGQHNAIVTLTATNTYKVEFMTQAMFAMTSVDAAAADPHTSNVQLTQLKHQVKIMSDLINTALGVSESPEAIPFMWLCSFRWTRNVSLHAKQQIVDELVSGMRPRGYLPVREHFNSDPNITFSHAKVLDPWIALNDWITAWSKIYPYGRASLTDPNVERLSFNQENASSVSALEVPEVRLPVLSPNFKCSIKWLEGPSEALQKSIAVILAERMSFQEYYTFETKIDDKELVMPIWHIEPLSVETAQAAWETACERLHQIHLGNYFTNSHVEGLADPAKDPLATSAQPVNGQQGIAIFPPPDPGYECSLLWLEGVSTETKTAVMEHVGKTMLDKGYTLIDWTPGEEKLQMWVSHPQPSTLEQANIDWIETYNSLELLQTYVTKPLLEAVYGLAASGQALNLPSRDPAYNCSLSWLSDPTDDVKRTIASSLIATVLEKGYRLISLPKIGSDKLTILFSHQRYSDLVTATADWECSRNALSPAWKVYTADPRCEPAFRAQANADVSTMVLPGIPPTYVCSLNWLEGPDQETKHAVISKVAFFMIQREYYSLSINDSTEKFSIFFAHGFPYDLATATADWTAAYDSLGLQQMYVTNLKGDFAVSNPKSEFTVAFRDGNISLNKLPLDDTAVTTNGTNDINDASASQEGLPPVNVETDAQPTAPAAETFASMRDNSLEEKKRLALKLLAAEGLVGFSSGV